MQWFVMANNLLQRIHRAHRIMLIPLSADKDKKLFAFEYLMDHYEGTNTRLRHEAERNEEERKRQILKYLYK